MAQILIVEDEVLLAKSLCRSLVGKGHDCITATSAEEGLALLEKMPTDIIILDIQLPGMSGLEAIQKIKNFDPNIGVIIVTAFATMASVVEAMRAGACDFLRKPLDTEEVSLAVERAIDDARLKQAISYYRGLEVEKTDEDRLVCNSARMKSAMTLIEQMVKMDLAEPSDYPPLLLLGETGTGKDLVARIIHYHGKFSQEAFIEVNCSTLPKGLEEAELFGYEKGSFTGANRSKRGLFEAATGGTIFLNEIGDLSAEAQVKLLTVIEHKTLRRVGGLRDIDVNLRIIAATNRDLKDSSAFREDLFYRLNNMTIDLPPLRERREDIVELAEMFLVKFGRKYGTRKTLSDEAVSVLTSYSWPGNVRELRQLMERVTFLDSGDKVTPAELNLPVAAGSAVSISSSGKIDIDFPAEGINLETVERELITAALKFCKGNASEAARRLGIGREAIRYKIKKYNLD